MTHELGRFDHHPDPAIDFCIEVEELTAMAYNRRVGFDPEPDLERRVERAMDFRVGGDTNAVIAKEILRAIEREVKGLPPISVYNPKGLTLAQLIQSGFHP